MCHWPFGNPMFGVNWNTSVNKHCMYTGQRPPLGTNGEYNYQNLTVFNRNKLILILCFLVSCKLLQCGICHCLVYVIHMLLCSEWVLPTIDCKWLMLTLKHQLVFTCWEESVWRCHEDQLEINIRTLSLAWQTHNDTTAQG